MDIKNTISYEPNYIKPSTAEPNIKQEIPAINDGLNIQITKASPVDETRKKEKLEEVIESVNTSNKKLQAFDRKLEISVHKKTREVMVKVIDTSTDEIIRELPPEKVLDNLASRREIMGILMDKKI